MLTELSATDAEARTPRISRALLRDSKQLDTALVALRTLLTGRSSDAVVKVVGEYIGMKEVNARTAGGCAQVMFETGQIPYAAESSPCSRHLRAR